uniref:RNA ligase family protein n=1 Tax=Thaumasiovibrio occultus TaxID=1891184 RepID=UPI000B361554|nr:RNA ligase family protein [Thaumasiovibrio occultus]
MNPRFKYPRTPHLPWSRKSTSDDLICHDTSRFDGKRVIVTEKMDGENTSLYPDGSHARSLDSLHHPSRDWVKRFHAAIAHDIPAGWRVCGENVYARHSVSYENLHSYFYGFSIWDNHNTCLSWDDTLEWFALLGITAPTVLFDGLWDEATIRNITIDTERSEGYVVRLADAFDYVHFTHSVAKWVRKGHVQTDTHWMHAEIVPNALGSTTTAFNEKSKPAASTSSARKNAEINAGKNHKEGQ